MWQDVLSKICPSETSCIDLLSKDWEQRKPLKGKKILVNCHLTLTTLFILRCLLKSGAAVEMASIGPLNVQKNIAGLLKKARIPFHQRNDRLKSDFDVLIDCGAYLYHIVNPKKGIVELTQTDKYEAADIPVISIDASPIKRIETYFGTGDGFWRALEAFFEQANQSQGTRLAPQDFKYALIGYGKVGKGIVHACLKNGVPKENLLILDSSEKACQTAREGNELLAFHLSLNNLKGIKSALQDYHFIILATGIEGVLSKWFKKEDLPESLLVINMGTPEEAGPHFKEAALNEAKPFNFVLEYPTKMLYLDPVFTALCMGAEMLCERKLPSGLQPFSLTHW